MRHTRFSPQRAFTVSSESSFLAVPAPVHNIESLYMPFKSRCGRPVTVQSPTPNRSIFALFSSLIDLPLIEVTASTILRIKTLSIKGAGAPLLIVLPGHRCQSHTHKHSSLFSSSSHDNCFFCAFILLYVSMRRNTFLGMHRHSAVRSISLSKLVTTECAWSLKRGFQGSFRNPLDVELHSSDISGASCFKMPSPAALRKPFSYRTASAHTTTLRLSWR